MGMRKTVKEGWVATIKASCPTCGDVELTTRDVQVLLCATTNQGSYTFQCPACRLAVSKPAEARIVDVLVASGVRLSVWQMPAELEEPREGAPISYDDLLAFHFELQRDDWFERLTGMLAGEDHS
jgi:rRNA maturation protein Nop10